MSHYFVKQQQHYETEQKPLGNHREQFNVIFNLINFEKKFVQIKNIEKEKTIILPIPNGNSIKIIDSSKFYNIFETLENSYPNETEYSIQGDFSYLEPRVYNNVNDIETLSNEEKETLSIFKNDFSFLSMKLSSQKIHLLCFSFSSFLKDKLFIPTFSLTNESRVEWNHFIYSMNSCKSSGQTIKDREIQFQKEKKKYNKSNSFVKFDEIPFEFSGGINDLRRTVIKGKWKNENLIYDFFVPKQKSFWNKLSLDSSDDEEEHNIMNPNIHTDPNQLEEMLRTGKLSENKKIQKVESNYGILDYIIDGDDPLEEAEE
eukprot:gene1998-1505_t